MDTIEKLKVLSEDSQYDLACACGTRDDDRRKRGREGKWLYPVTLPQGGHSVLLKTLLSNACVNDCRYCPLAPNPVCAAVRFSPRKWPAYLWHTRERRMYSGCS